MKQTLIRGLLFLLCLLCFYLLVGNTKHDAVLNAFVLTYILEPAFTELLSK